MHKIENSPTFQLGFTLVEMAIVLIIIGLLTAGLISPLGVQRDIRDYTETRAELAEMRQALMGFALTNRASGTNNPYLPCPDTNNNGEENRVGGVCSGPTGDFPWVTLGLGQSDSWNNRYLYSVAPDFSNSVNGFDLSSGGSITIKSTSGAAANLATAIPAAIVSKGKNGFGTSTDEQENAADGNATFVSKSQIEVTANAFDDVVVWTPPAVLINRMVSAGRLP